MPTRDQLDARWQEITAELAEIERTRIVPVCQALGGREQKLLAEQDAIEYELEMLEMMDASE